MSGPGSPEAKAGGNAETRMRVSVTVPARDEERTLGRLLDALLDQSCPPAEIIVVDAGSRDGTGEIARRYAPKGVRLIEAGVAYPGRARNRGIESARNDWVALTDAGCVPQRDWLEALVSSAVGPVPAVRIVYGSYSPDIHDEWDLAQALTIVPPIESATGCRPLSIASALIHRSAWREVGGFREDLRAAEDLLFFRAVDRAGITTVRAPRAVVWWMLPSGPRAIFRRLRLYSFHHLQAGLFKTWHRRVLLMDLAAAGLALAALYWPPLMLGVLVALVARIARSIVQHRLSLPGTAVIHADRLARAGVLILLADLAAWAGSVDHLFHWIRWRRHRKGVTSVEPA